MEQRAQSRAEVKRDTRGKVNGQNLEWHCRHLIADRISFHEPRYINETDKIDHEGSKKVQQSGDSEAQAPSPEHRKRGQKMEASSNYGSGQQEGVTVMVENKRKIGAQGPWRTV